MKLIAWVVVVVLLLGFWLALRAREARRSPSDESAQKFPQATSSQSKDAEQALIIVLQLSERDFGTEQRRKAMFKLEDDLSAAVERSKAGVFDGNEIGERSIFISMANPLTRCLRQSYQFYGKHRLMSNRT
jgi:hypothetical protein